MISSTSFGWAASDEAIYRVGGSTDCSVPACGDGVVDSGEECDGGENCTDECATVVTTSNAAAEDGCGCSSTDGGFKPPAEALFLLLLLGIRRRRRD